MDTIFTSSENGKTSEPYRLLLNLVNKINLKRSEKYFALSTWNEKFELPDGSYSVSDIQDCFEYIIKKHQLVTDNPLIRLDVNKKENRITFKIRQGIMSNF